MTQQSGARSLIQNLAIPVTFFVIFFALGSIQPFLIPFLRHRFPSLPPVQCSMVLATVYFSFGVFRFLAGYLIYALGSKQTVVLGAVGYFLFALLVYVLRVYALIMLAAVVWGIAASLFWTAGSTQVLDSSDRAQYGIRAGVLNLSAKIGITLGVAVLGAILERHGYGGLFSVALAIGSVGVLTAFLIPNSPHRAGWPQWRGLGDFYVRRRGIIMAAVFVVPGLAYGHMLGLINLYIIDTVGEAYVGRITSTFLASGVLFSLIGGQASDRFGRRLPLVISFLLGAGGLLSMSYPTNPWILACGAFLLGVQFGTVPTVILAWVGDHVPPGERALGHASIFAWRDLGIGVSILLGGSFTQWGWPYRSVFLLSASIFLMAALVSWAFVTEAAGTARR